MAAKATEMNTSFFEATQMTVAQFDLKGYV